MTLRVVTWNMAHRVRMKKRAWDFLRYEIAPDIAMVQEAHLPDSIREGEQFVCPENVTGTIGASGIWSRELALHRVPLDTTLPNAVIVSTVSLPKGLAPLLVISMYGTFDKTSHVTPNLHRMISDLHPVLISKTYKGRILLGGDWNIDRSYNEINPGTAPRHELVFERLEDEFYGLQRCNKEPLRTIMHRSKFAYQDDYIYASENVIPKLISCGVVKDPDVEKLSDHQPVVAVFEM
jgi:exonuclease III